MNSRRLDSLDAFRGFDMMWIMGAASIVTAICALTPAGADCWLARQMEHVEWHGLAFMDLIFPTFLFIAGISFPYSYASQKAKGFSSAKIHLRILKRALLLIIFGFLYNGMLASFDFADFRYCSVLGRIGLAWMSAALIFIHFGKKARIGIVSALLIGYYLLMRFCHVPGAPAGADPFSLEWNLAGYIDRLIVPGKMYLGTFDPEGLFGVIPATATAMFGMFTGEYVKEGKTSGGRKALAMASAAVILLLAGIAWNVFFPINKNLWSSSFVCVAAALGLLTFALFYYIIDVKGFKKWAFPLKVIGMNSITIYMAMVFINFWFTAEQLLKGTVSLMPEKAGHLVLVTGIFLLRWAFLYFLYRKKVFLKI